jgi:hypothetical protein
MDEQAAAPLFRFDIERWVPARVDTDELELDRWEVVRRTEGVWDYDVLIEFLKDRGAVGMYRVIRYADNYADVSVFDVGAETHWHLDRHVDESAPLPVPDGES